jgi:hypothetical protein
MRSPLFQQRIRQLSPISGHEIASQYGAQGRHVAAGAVITMTPTDWSGRKAVRAWLVKSYPLLPLWGDGGVQLFNGDGVSLAQQGGVFLFDFARDAHVQA